MTEYDKEYFWYWFVNIKGIGNLTRVRLMERFGHPQYLYDCNLENQKDLLTETQMGSISKSREYSRIEDGLKRLVEENIRFVHWESPDYPSRFRNLYDPPYGFYLKGELPDPNRPAVAVVGSRRPSQYGRKVSSMFASELASKGIVIVSGMASGVDSEAHRAALEVSGMTLGILGGGIDSMYPKENWNLYLDMYESGGILSEYNVGIPNRAGLFPMRNRLISGISDFILVVEAGEKSGSLITADQGMEQGKDVYVVPGRITDIMSRGCNHLIAQGASVAESPQSFLDDLRTFCDSPKGRHLSLIPEEGSGSEYVNKSISRQPYTAEEHKILEILDEIDAKSFDTILTQTGMSRSDLQHLLFGLEMRSCIVQSQQNMYLKTI